MVGLPPDSVVAIAAEGLNPLLTNRVVAEFGGGDPAAELNGALVDQATESQGRGLLQAGEAVLLMGEPAELTGGDDAAGDGIEEELTDRHGECNGT